MPELITMGETKMFYCGKNSAAGCMEPEEYYQGIG